MKPHQQQQQQHVVAVESSWQNMNSPSMLESFPEPGQHTAVITARKALKTMRHDRKLTRAVLRVPLPMIYFVVYVVMIAAHIPASGLFKQSNALYTTLAGSGSTTVTKDSPMLFFNIATPADIFNWLELTFAPSVFVTQDYNEQDLPSEQWGRIATYNQVLGAVSFKITYGIDNYCDNQEFLDIIYPTCYTTSGTYEYLQLYSVTLDVATAADYIKEMKNQSMLNASTEEFKITVATFNGELSSYGVTTLKFEFQEGGFIEPTASTVGAISDPYMGSKPIVADSLLGACFLLVLGHQLARLWRNRRELMDHMNDFWHIVDYASTILIVAFYVIWALIIVASRDETLQTNISGFSATNYDWLDDYAAEDLDTMITALERIGKLTVALRLIATVTIILLGVRILERFRFHPRLNLLSHTISRSLAKFGAFAVVFLIVVVTFALSGHFIFGDRAKEFSTIKASLEACINILFGNFDFVSIENLIVPVPIIYYWGYLIIANLILLNMMLAIVLDTYEEVSDEAYKDKTITSFSRITYIAMYNLQLWFRDAAGLCKKGHRVSLKMVEEIGGADLSRQEVVFRGRIRPDVLEAVLDALVASHGEKELIQNPIELTPVKLMSMFANAQVTESEARATIDYLLNGVHPLEDEEKDEHDGQKQRRQPVRSILRSRVNTTGTARSPALGADAPWDTFTNTEAQQLAERMAALERKLELILAHVVQK